MTDQEKHLIIGMGNVGLALALLIDTANEREYRIDLAWRDPHIETVIFDFIHICIPDTPQFEREVCNYLIDFATEETITIIHSTVKPGTTKKIALQFPRTAYSPVRGYHPNLKEGLIHFPKMFATENQTIISSIVNLFMKLNMKPVVSEEDPTILEYAKHFNTEWRLMQIVHAQEIAMIIQKHDFPVDTIKEFFNSTEDRTLPFYAQQVGIEDHDHCLLPNAKVLNTDLSNSLIKLNKQFGRLFGEKKIPLR